MKIIKHIVTINEERYNFEKYCCNKMNNAVQNRYIKQFNSELRIPFKDTSSALNSTSDIMFSIQKIDFCPWCGEKIEVI